MYYRNGLLALALCGCASAQNERPPGPPPELVTDRPGFTEPTNVVSPGALQTENGFSFDWGRGGSRLLTAGSPLIRVGISKRLELRLESDGYLATRERGELGMAYSQGMADSGIGAKLAILEETRFRPAISILPSLSLPTGHPAFSSRGYDPTLNLSWSKDLPAGFNVGGNAILASASGEQGQLWQKAFSLSASRDLPQGFNGYGEIFSVRPSGRLPVNVFNGGVTHLLSANVQVDVEAGWAVAGPGPQLFLAGGLVIRHPRALAWFMRR